MLAPLSARNRAFPLGQNNVCRYAASPAGKLPIHHCMRGVIANGEQSSALTATLTLYVSSHGPILRARVYRLRPHLRPLALLAGVNATALLASVMRSGLSAGATRLERLPTRTGAYAIVTPREIVAQRTRHSEDGGFRVSELIYGSETKLATGPKLVFQKYSLGTSDRAKHGLQTSSRVPRNRPIRPPSARFRGPFS